MNGRQRPPIVNYVRGARRALTVPLLFSPITVRTWIDAVHMKMYMDKIAKMKEEQDQPEVMVTEGQATALGLMQLAKG